MALGDLFEIEQHASRFDEAVQSVQLTSHQYNVYPT